MKYTASNVAAALDGLGVEDTPVENATSSADFPSIVIGEVLSDRVQAILETKPKVRGYFEGRGKTEAFGPDGRSLDSSSSGMDFSLVMALIRRGVTDPSELGTAIYLRPDGAAQAKGIPYIARTVGRALERAAATERDRKEGESCGPDFRIDKIRIFASNPATYEFTVEGTTFRVTSAELKIKSRFATRFMDALRRIPLLPGRAEAWRTIVNGWLEKAEIVEMPPEASEEFALQEAIEEAIQNLRPGVEVTDLDRGASFRLEGGDVGFKTKAILKALRDEHPDLKANEVCRVLRGLGYGSLTPKVGDKAVRVWVKQ